jgi:hypothetical protein
VRTFDTPEERHDYFSEIEELIQRIGLRENWEMPERNIWDDQWMIEERDNGAKYSEEASE